MKKIIPYGRQWIDETDIQAVTEVLQSDWLTTGPYVKRFEEQFARYAGAKYAVAVANGTAALHLAALAADLSDGDEVITSPMTFAASANCALYAGAKPVFADISPVTYNLDPDQVRQKITARTKAMIPVHYAGLPCEMAEFAAIAKEHHLTVIEDACHAVGAVYRNERIGSCVYSDMTVFSFHPVKHITTGEGGAITTNNKELYEKLCLLRTHGILREPEKLTRRDGDWYYEMQALGYNYRITDLQCALGSSQLNRQDSFLARRREIAHRYNEAFASLPAELPHDSEEGLHAYHLYVLKLKPDAGVTRKALFDELKERGIYCQVHYIPVHTFPYYRDILGCQAGSCPVAEEHYERIVSLPMFPKLTDEEVEYVINCVCEVLQ